MSTHEIRVVKVKLEPHPDADTLGVARIDGYTVVVKISDWITTSLGIYVPPDYVVDGGEPEFEFLGSGPHRIKVRRIRGIQSMGLLVPAREYHREGDNVINELGITRYEPPESPLDTGGENCHAPAIRFLPVMDIENLRSYPDALLVPHQASIPLVVTEKIHGASGRWVVDKSGEFFAGSRKTWKKADDNNIWWKVTQMYPDIERFCRTNPEIVLYGEVFGKVQDLKYGKTGVDVAMFDTWNGRVNGWCSWEVSNAVLNEFEIPQVPLIDYKPWVSNETLYDLAEGPSLIKGAEHGREGIVVGFAWEQPDHRKIGRRKVKVVSNWYLSRHEKAPKPSKPKEPENVVEVY